MLKASTLNIKLPTLYSLLAENEFSRDLLDFKKWGQKVLLQWYFVQNFLSTNPCHILVWFGLNPSIILMTCLYVSRCHLSRVPLRKLLLWVDLHSKMAFHMARQSEWQLYGRVIRAVIVTSLLLYIKEFWGVQTLFVLCCILPKQMSNLWREICPSYILLVCLQFLSF